MKVKYLIRKKPIFQDESEFLEAMANNDYQLVTIVFYAMTSETIYYFCKKIKS